MVVRAGLALIQQGSHLPDSPWVIDRPPTFDLQARERALRTTARRSALTWAMVYLLLAGLWVLLSSEFLPLLGLGPDEAVRAEQVKGLLFVVVTSVIVYIAVLSTAARAARLQAQAATEAAESIRREERWRHLMASLSEVAWFTSADGKELRYISPSTTVVYGQPPEAFFERPSLWLDVVHPEDLAAVRAGLADIERTGYRVIEYRIRHADGSWRWLRDRGSVLRDAQGRVVGVGGVAEDVTERRRVLQDLHERELQLAGIVETAMDAIITIDHRFRVRLFNQSAARIFGLPAAHAIGQPLDRFLPMEARLAHAEHLQSFARTGMTARRMGALRPLTGLRSNGEAFPIEASISKLGEGEQVLMTVVLRDVTELRRAEAAREAQRTAEAASRAKTEFLSRMSHELRTPLNAVLGFAQLLQTSGEPLGERQRVQVEHIRSAGWHLLALINDVLDVSRIEAGMLQVSLAPVDARAAVAEALRLSASQAQQLGVRLDPLPPGPPLMVTVDATRLRQVLLNLLSNAIKYNRRDGRVHIDASWEADRLRLVVADTGLGMTAEQKRKLFEPFNRLGREHGGIEGTGIGLTLTRELVLLMDGDIDVDSEPERGTIVTVHLPRAPAGENVVWNRTTASAAGALDGEVELAGTVLYIEDNPINLLVVEQLLTRWPGVTLAPAEDGEQGLAMAARLRPDLVLLDMRLPDLDGLQVLQRLRDDPATVGLRVVALSASAMPEEVAAARAAGALEYWTKPLDFDRFIADMTRLLKVDTPAAAAPV